MRILTIRTFPAILALSSAIIGMTVPKLATAQDSLWSKNINFSGLIDGYYDYNANHPLQSDNGNQLRNFDFNSNAFSLSMAKLTVAHDPGPVGFRLDLGFGKAFTTILASEPNFKYLEQAYVSYKPANARGFEADFGQFVTSAGAEVIEANSNWNYSRSLLFALAIPYYHVGLRTTFPITSAFTAGLQLVNGWNHFTDNNSGKTIGITGAWTKPKFTLSTNYYVGPENDHTNKGYRNLLDGTLLLTPTTKLSAYINYDYGQNRNATEIAPGVYQISTLSRWQGVALDLHYQATNKIAFSPRWEYYSDPNGSSTGLAQNLNEFTLTGEYKLHDGMLGRIEYRRDHSDHDFFNRGNELAPSQSTLEVALIAFFSPKR
jgi:hypothetical protein